MPIGELISIIALALSLAGSVVGGLVYAFKVGGMVTTLSVAISKIQALEEAAAALPVLAAKVEQQGEAIIEIARKLSDYPKMREKLDSVNEDVDELRALKIDSRLAVVEERARPPRPTSQQMSRTIIPRREEDK